MATIRLLDLCCKAGGCSVGYYQAAQELGLDIEITGVDIEPQPNYPYMFIQSDAAEFFKQFSPCFTHVHASPPCQQYSASTIVPRNKGKQYKDNLGEILTLAKGSNLPWVIENVMPAPIDADMVLRGDMFGLKVLRARKFQFVNWFCMKPYLPKQIGTVKNGDYAQVVGKGQLKTTGGKRFKVPGDNILQVWRNAMGIDWMTTKELAEAIPPAYTKYIGIDFFKQPANLLL